MVLLPLLQTDCGRPGGCGTADDPATILRASDHGRVGTSPDNKPAWRAMALAGAAGSVRVRGQGLGFDDALD
jgi:hypothetical protein